MQLDVTCPYCGEVFNLDPNGNYPDELYQDQESIERICPKCKKMVSVSAISEWSYEVDREQSDELNE